jgi:iron(II)-dependent oxidoreductase
VAPQYDARTDLTWVKIPGGTFNMGSSSGDVDEKPVHRVRVESFWLAKSEVTVSQYRRCVTAGSCGVPFTGGDCNWGVSGRDNHPVNCVFWGHSVAYARWAGGRLPSESEWEYAARSGGRSWTYPWGNEAPSCARAVMADGKTYGCGTSGTWAVCSKEKGNTVHGVCDMTGNVFEWVQDRYYYSYIGAPRDGSAWERLADASRGFRIGGARLGVDRVSRGGSWAFSGRYLRASARSHGSPGLNIGDLGFRVVRLSP